MVEDFELITGIIEPDHLDRIYIIACQAGSGIFLFVKGMEFIHDVSGRVELLEVT